MKNYDFNKAACIIEAEQANLETAELGMYNDWDWTSKAIYEDGALVVDLGTVKEIAGIPGSSHDTPVLVLTYKSGEVQTLNCYQGESTRTESRMAHCGGMFTPSGNNGLPAPIDYAARYDYTAPPAPNGVRTLLICFFFALVLGSMLSSCAPARIPLGSVTRHAAHDPRTKTVEPTPAKPVR